MNQLYLGVCHYKDQYGKLLCILFGLLSLQTYDAFAAVQHFFESFHRVNLIFTKKICCPHFHLKCADGYSCNRKAKKPAEWWCYCCISWKFLGDSWRIWFRCFWFWFITVSKDVQICSINRYKVPHLGFCVTSAEFLWLGDNAWTFPSILVKHEEIIFRAATISHIVWLFQFFGRQIWLMECIFLLQLVLHFHVVQFVQ